MALGEDDALQALAPLTPLKFIHARPQGLFALALGRPHTRAITLIDKNTARAPSAYLLFIIITRGGISRIAALYPSLLSDRKSVV